MRTIDADALQLAIVEEGQANKRKKYIIGDIWELTGAEIREVINSQPTIQPEPHWIPVTERLPEEDDYKSCIECLDGAVWYFTENGTMGIGYYYKSTKEWSTTDDLKTDGKVIAWMPLPEPYREDGNE